MARGPRERGGLGRIAPLAGREQGRPRRDEPLLLPQLQRRRMLTLVVNMERMKVVARLAQRRGRGAVGGCDPSGATVGHGGAAVLDSLNFRLVCESWRSC